MDASKIPAELRTRRQWLTWFYSSEGQKIPNGKSNDPSTWKNFGELDGDLVAFVISSDDPYTGIDLDDCYLPDGTLTRSATEVLERFRGIAYAEVSPSGTGIKLITIGRKPLGSRCQRDKWLECYDYARYWTITGRVLDGFTEISEGQEAVNWLCSQYLKPIEPKPAQRPLSSNLSCDKGLLKRAQDYVSAAKQADEGQRNNTVFSLAGHLAAITGGVNERLSEDDINGYMQQWNASLSCPLDEKEVKSAVSSAMRNGTPREIKPAEVQSHTPALDIDWDKMNLAVDNSEIEDDDYCCKMVPGSGLLRQVYDFYNEKAYRRSPVMGLAVAVSFCQMLFGRRVRSHTDIRTNDYNLVLATTGAGKEACETTITQILDASDSTGKFMIPPDVQSGNGLMKALSLCESSIWVCDEFGKILQAVLDKKGNQHIKNIGNHLLKLYGKSSGTYGGAAHSDGIRNRIVQPHLCILGLSTSSTVFDAISTEQVSDGLMGRIAFWPVQDRPEPRDDMTITKPAESLVDAVKKWMEFTPLEEGKNLTPKPETLRMSADALRRWHSHSHQINERMRSETELRAAIWSRAAARSMKLALTYRAARLDVDPGACQWDFVQVESEDIEWAISLSNWLAKIACGLIRENVYDKSGEKAKAILLKATEDGKEVSKRELLRTFRSVSAGDVQSAADSLGFETIQSKTKGRPKVTYRRRQQVVDE